MKTTFSNPLRLLFAFCAALWAGAATGVAADRVTGLTMVPQLTIEGTFGATDQIQYCTNLSQRNWVPLTNLLVQATNYSFVDVGAPLGTARYYQVVRLSPDGMVLIPAGNFAMGDGVDGWTPALPVHTVYVSAFFMDQHKVTKALWDQVKAWNGGNGYSYENPGSGKAATHPVVKVNWLDSVKWCNARSEMEGLTPVYYTTAAYTSVLKSGAAMNTTPYWKPGANGYRLPTEAEWEKAARGGASGHRFPWTDAETISHSRANYYANSNTNENGVVFYWDLSYPEGYD